MGELTIYGYSDDLLELRGDIREEGPIPRNSKILLTDGTLIQVNYNSGWRLKVEETGENTSHTKYSAETDKAEEITGRNHSDVVKLENENHDYDKAYITNNIHSVIQE